jgi:hypothetical protein
MTRLSAILAADDDYRFIATTLSGSRPWLGKGMGKRTDRSKSGSLVLPRIFFTEIVLWEAFS